MLLCVIVSLAESCITKGLAELTKNVSIYWNDIKAQLYVWQYIIAYRHHCDMVGDSTQRPIGSPFVGILHS